MLDPPPTGQGPGVTIGHNANSLPFSSSHSPSSSAAPSKPVTPTPVGDSKARGVSKKITPKSFQEIISREKVSVLEIATQMIDPPQNATLVEKSLTFDDFADFLFDHLKINPDDCSSYSFSQFSNNSKELKFKPLVDISPYIGSFSFRGHSFLTRRQGNRTVRLTFREVPHFVCDEELLNIVQCYGAPTDSVMHYDQSPNPKCNGLVNVSTRHMEITLGDKQIPNYFWVEGVHPGDKSVRITVTHPGQEPQCYNCLCAGSACPGAGKGKACKSTNTPKARLDEYMQRLRIQHGYVSLKAKHAANFPALGGKKPPTISVEMVSVEEEKDKIISELQEKVKTMERRRLDEEKERLEQEGLAESQVEAETRIATEQKLRAEEAERFKLELSQVGYTMDGMKECLQLLEPEVHNCLQKHLDDDNEMSFDRVVGILSASAYLPDFGLSFDESQVIPPPGFLEHSNMSEPYAEKLDNVRSCVLEMILKKKRDFSRQAAGLTAAHQLRDRLILRNKRKSESQQEDDENSSLAPSRKRASSVSAKPAPPSTEEEVTPAAPPGPSSTASPSTVAAVPDSPPVSSTLQPCAKSLESSSESLDASQPPPLPSTSS